CGATGIITDEPEPEECCECDGTGKLGESNPLLEEYVDCLHFILSIGLELQIPDEWDIENISSIIGLSSIINLNNGILGNFNGIFQNVFADMGISEWFEVMENFLGMGQLLGFTWEQIEQAYLDKNKINHERQDGGY